jgi:hypothetical protein
MIFRKTIADFTIPASNIILLHACQAFSEADSEVAAAAAVDFEVVLLSVPHVVVARRVAALVVAVSAVAAALALPAFLAAVRLVEVAAAAVAVDFSVAAVHFLVVSKIDDHRTTNPLPIRRQ